MTTQHTENLELGRATTHERSEALNLVYAALASTDRQQAVDATLGELRAGKLSAQALHVARRGGRLVGAALAKPHPGRTAVVWPPQLTAATPELVADQLFAQIDAQLATEGVVIAQVLAHRDAPQDVPRIRRAGYDHLTDLEYLVCGLEHLSAADVEAHDDGSLTFETYRESQASRLAQLIQRTYEGTRDCPQLNDVRDMHDVLAGHRATGQFTPERWSFVLRDGVDVGCLLLAHHFGSTTWELVYMGIVPTARGGGDGLRIVRYAQHSAASHGATSLVLAMDTRNDPARMMYERAGFAAWDARAVYWKQLSLDKTAPTKS